MLQLKNKNGKEMFRFFWSLAANNTSLGTSNSPSENDYNKYNYKQLGIGILRFGV